MLPAPIAKLIREFQRLPGVGEKTATRFALHVLRRPTDEACSLARTLEEVTRVIRPCSKCFQLTDDDPCGICRSPRRNGRLLCVVEDQSSLMALERSRVFHGRYHVLGGRLSPMDGIGPGQLRIRELVDRVGSDGVEEVVLATNPDAEGDATALYVKKCLEGSSARVTRIARGIPIGGDLEYADALTLGKALEGRERY